MEPALTCRRVPDDVLLAHLGAVERSLRAIRADLVNETRAQHDIARGLASAGFVVRREVTLGPHMRIDFVVPCPVISAGNIGIEVKLKRGVSPTQAFVQIEEYAATSGIDAIILATGIPMRLPETISGKPARLVALGLAWHAR